MQALKALKAKRASVKTQCTRTRNAIDAIDPQEIDIAYVKQRKQRFAEHWNQFNDIQAQIHELLELAEDLDGIDKADLQAEQEEECINFEESYFRIASKIERLLATTQIEAANANGNEGYVRDINQIHLPKISIPKFTGNYEDWYPFYNTFESMIHLNPKLTNIQRFHYLISSLEADAAHVIESGNYF